MACHKYTPEQDRFLRDNVSGRSVIELTAMFNECFNLNLRYAQISGALRSRGIHRGVVFRFKKGHIPPNRKTLGSEKLNSDGYVTVKMSNVGSYREQWKRKHIVIWEQHYEPLKKDEVILFGDGDKTNFDIDNLIKISRRELGMLNKRGLIKNDAELTRTGVLIADVLLKANEVKKNRTKSRKA